MNPVFVAPGQHYRLAISTEQTRVVNSSGLISQLCRTSPNCQRSDSGFSIIQGRWMKYE